MTKQLDWQEFWANDDRQRAVRHTLIEDLPDRVASDRVKRLLHALDDLSQTSWKGVKIERQANGSVRLTVPLAAVTLAMGVSENTAKNYIKEADSTGFLEWIKSSHRPHTYSIRWQAVLDRSASQWAEPIPAEVTSAKPTGPGSDGRGESRGSTPDPQGVNLTPSRGSVEPLRGGQFEGLKGVNLTPSSESPGFESPGLWISKSKSPGFKSRGGQRPPGRMPPFYPTHDPTGKFPVNGAFWREWKHAIATRNLRNPAHVQQLYELAVEAGCFEDTLENRAYVFVQAAHDIRAAKRTPTAYFRENVPVKRPNMSHRDIEEGLRMRDTLDAATPRESGAEEVERVEAPPAREPHPECVETPEEPIRGPAKEEFQEALAEVMSRIRARSPH